MRLVNCGCGGEAEIDCHLGDLNRCNLYYVYCHKCHITSANYHSEAEAVTAWNQAMSGFVNDTNVGSKEPERKKGEWLVQPSTGDDRPNIWWKCSVCGQVVFSETERDRKEFHAFCGRCGADMRGE